MDRRFVRRAVFAAVGGCWCLASVAAARGFPGGVSAGDVTSGSVVLWARTDTAGAMTFEVASDAGFAAIVSTMSVQVTDVRVPGKVEVDGLLAGATHYYRVTDGGSAVASGRFRTAASGERTGLRFGVSGDWRGELSPYPSVSNVAAKELDFFVALGDTIYADVASPSVPVAQCVTIEQFRDKHLEGYGERHGLNVFAELRASTAWFANIDDHEVTNDFAGGAPAASDPRFGGAGLINDHPLYETGLLAFQEYNPARDEFWAVSGDPRTDGERRLYRSRVFGRDAAIHMLDARSFRDEELPGVTDPLDPAQAQAFLQASFDPTRTMLGRVQVERLKADMLAAKQAGVTWQFVLVPEPIQNLGVILASDRFEGYAAERTEILHFVRSNDIRNVVFVAADIHGTVVNNLTYSFGVGEAQVNANAFEVVTGAVAYAAPFGPTVAGLVASFGLPGAIPLGTYLSWTREQQENYIALLINAQVFSLGYDFVGLEESSIRATLLEGGYTATNTYGWTEFEIDAGTRELTVTTWGIDWYDEAELNANPGEVTTRVARVVSRFVVRAQPTCLGDTDGNGTVDFLDLNNVLSDFGGTGEFLLGDSNLDGACDFLDLVGVLGNYGVGCG